MQRVGNSYQIAFGVVLFTATLAFGSAYYTLSTLNAPGALIPWIALGWSIFILFLDREIAGSLDKTTAIVRPFLALFIGTLVAIPIELWVFQERIDQELQRQYRQDNKQQIDELGCRMNPWIEDRRNNLSNWIGRAALNKRRTGGRILDSEAVGRVGQGRTGCSRGWSRIFRTLGAQQSAIRQRIQEVRHESGSDGPVDRRKSASVWKGDSDAKRLGRVTDFGNPLRSNGPRCTQF